MVFGNKFNYVTKFLTPNLIRLNGGTLTQQPKVNDGFNLMDKTKKFMPMAQLITTEFNQLSCDVATGFDHYLQILDGKRIPIRRSELNYVLHRRD